ncbi:YitT family protein [Leucobacter soli]|uniref:Membrane protein YczE n=1 Tax=Leucobacter soli TaxID=2812850 RepID=A0A916NNU1_9MICO|nr:hypothetical protein [Leucobacter soli]CAG7610342.1 hypothetical protein LEUCIP111803_01302 [Leucobacter soli]
MLRAVRRPSRGAATVWANRSARLLGGLALFGIGIGLFARAAIGVPPWDVLAQGVAYAFGWTFGLSTMVVSGVVLLLWIPLRQRFGIGTVINVLVTGPFVDLTMLVVPAGLPFPVRLGLFAGGVLALGIGTGIYLSAGLAPGPRDGLMTGLHALTGWNIGLVRTGIEIGVLGVGALLGGNLGWGTLAFALTIGPVCAVTIPLFARERGTARPS